MEIIIRFRQGLDSWEVIRRYGFHETLVGVRQSFEEATELANSYMGVA